MEFLEILFLIPDPNSFHKNSSSSWLGNQSYHFLPITLSVKRQSRICTENHRKHDKSKSTGNWSIRNIFGIAKHIKYASMMFNIWPRTIIPSVNNRPANKPKATQRRNKRRATVKKYYDKTAKDLNQLKVGDLVYYNHSEGNKRDWRKGKKEVDEV